MDLPNGEDLATREECEADTCQACVADAIRCDGRGHFLSQYDGEEVEAGEFFIYRLN